jgi:exosortase
LNCFSALAERQPKQSGSESRYDDETVNISRATYSGSAGERDVKIDLQQMKSSLQDLYTKRNVLFLLSAAIAFLAAVAPIRAFMKTPMGGYYTHIALIPLVSLYLLFLKQKQISERARYSPIAGLPVVISGGALFFVAWLSQSSLDLNNHAAVTALSVVIFINGSFILLYGPQAYRTALFPLLFLMFTIPLPTDLMDCFITFLQKGSTEFTNLLFMVSGVPYIREGFVFQLSNVSVEVARQCSGIRSAMAIFITAILAGYFFLRSNWKIFILAACAVLIAMFKNGIRIITLSLLGNYVDPRILQSDLHREGGIPIFVVALILLAPILFFLMRSEKKKMNRE